MPLTDPSNVRVGQARRRALMMKLAAQMAAKGGRGRQGIQSAGRAFGNSVDLRGPAAARLQLPFNLPNGRMRPAGYDPTPPGLVPDPTMSGTDGAVLTSAGSGLLAGGASGTSMDPAADPMADPNTTMTPYQGPTQSVAAGTEGFVGGIMGVPGAGSTSYFGAPAGVDFSGTDFTQSAPLSQPIAPPDPYTVMMGRLRQLQLQRVNQASGW